MPFVFSFNYYDRFCLHVSILKNSEFLVKKLALLRVSSGSRFLKIDIKKYFMEGLHSQFVQYSAEFVEMKWRPFYEAVLQHILETQFIEVESLDGRFVESLKRVRHFSHFGRHSHISCFIFKSLWERSHRLEIGSRIC